MATPHLIVLLVGRVLLLVGGTLFKKPKALSFQIGSGWNLGVLAGL